MRHRFTPETVLCNGLRGQGIDIITRGHSDFSPMEDYDVAHVHHLGRAAIKMASAKRSDLFIYTSHDPRLVSQYKLPWKRMIATRIVVNRADAIITLSDNEMKKMSKLFGKYQTRIVEISNGFTNEVCFIKLKFLRRQAHTKYCSWAS